MRVGQLKSRMPPPSLLLLLLLLSVDLSTQKPEFIPTHSNPLPSLYIPVGVGSTPDVTKLKEGFGVFGNYMATTPDANAEVKDEFTTCGTINVKALNQNYQKSGDGNMQYTIFCEPAPDRVIVRADGQDFDFGALPRDLKKECEVLTCSAEQYPAANTQTGQMTIQSYHYETMDDGKTRDGGKTGKTVDVQGVPVHSAAPENQETNVCKDKKPGFSNGKTGSAMISNEGHCYDVHANLKTAIQDNKGQYMQIPRWLQPGEQVRNKRSAFFSGEHSLFHTRLQYTFKTPTQMNNLPYRTCSSQCDSGSVVKLTMKNTQYKVAITIDPKQCDSFRICLGADGFELDDRVPMCDHTQIIDILVKNGVVKWPNEGRASLIELLSPKKPLDTPVTIEFGYGVTVNGQVRSEFYVGNDHREIVSSTSKGFKQDLSKRLAFFFPNENCLAKKAGIFTRYAETGKALSSDEAMKAGANYDDTLIPIVAPQAETPQTTTIQPVYHFVQTTTQPAPRVVPGAINQAPADVQNTIEGQRAVYKTGKWWTWGIYLGFVSGTLLTLGVGAGLFYLLRRTVFAIWYRGMYKRYGCDASGTTGGLTGVGFGNTVTGDVTVQGTTGGTTMGGTTGTSTGTSTMGGTTDGTSTGATETSTLLDKTEGTKSIAM